MSDLAATVLRFARKEIPNVNVRIMDAGGGLNCFQFALPNADRAHYVAVELRRSDKTFLREVARLGAQALQRPAWIGTTDAEATTSGAVSKIDRARGRIEVNGRAFTVGQAVKWFSLRDTVWIKDGRIAFSSPKEETP